MAPRHYRLQLLTLLFLRTFGVRVAVAVRRELRSVPPSAGRSRAELCGSIVELFPTEGKAQLCRRRVSRGGGVAADLVRDRDLVSRELGQPTELEKMQKRG